MRAAARHRAGGSRRAGAGPFSIGDPLIEWEPSAAQAALSVPPRLAATLALAAATLAPHAVSAVTSDWVTVGAPGNAADTSPVNCGASNASPCGAVATTYEIGRSDVTNAQYAEFLNEVTAADTLRSTTGAWAAMRRSAASRAARLGKVQLRREVRLREQARYVRLVLGRVALLQMAPERAADGPADVSHDRGRLLHAHARGGRYQLGAAQRGRERLGVARAGERARPHSRRGRRAPRRGVRPGEFHAIPWCPRQAGGNRRFRRSRGLGRRRASRCARARPSARTEGSRSDNATRPGRPAPGADREPAPRARRPGATPRSGAVASTAVSARERSRARPTRRRDPGPSRRLPCGRARRAPRSRRA